MKVRDQGQYSYNSLGSKTEKTYYRGQNFLKPQKYLLMRTIQMLVRRKRRELMPELKAARERGDIAYLRNDKLIIHPRTSTPK